MSGQRPLLQIGAFPPDIKNKQISNLELLIVYLIRTLLQCVYIED